MVTMTEPCTVSQDDAKKTPPRHPVPLVSQPLDDSSLPLEQVLYFHLINFNLC
jgi:hypothetical protein